MQENEKHLAYDPKYGVKSYWQLEAKFPGKDWEIFLCPFGTKEKAEDNLNFLQPKVIQGVELRITEKHEPKKEYQRTCTPEWYENGFEIIKSYVRQNLQSITKGIVKSEILDFARKEADAKILLEKVKAFYANEKHEPNDANLERMYCDENGLYFFEIVEINPDYTHGNLRDILNGLNEPDVESEVLAYIIRLQNVIAEWQSCHEKGILIYKEKDSLNKDENELVVKLQAELQRKEQIAQDALNTAKQAVETSERQAESIVILQTQNKKAEELLDEAQKTINQQNFILNSIKANQPISEVDKTNTKEVAAELDILRSKLSNAENEIRTLTINLQNAEAKYKLAVENSQTVIDELKEKLRYTEQESRIYADKAQQFAEARQSDLLTQFATLSAKHKIDENQLYVWTVINTGDNGVYWRYIIGKQSDFKEMAKFADGASSPIFVPALVNFFLCDGNRGGCSTIKFAKPEYAEQNQRWQCIFI